MKQKAIHFFKIYQFYLLIIFMLSSCTSNWSQYRGADKNIIAADKNLPIEWGTNKNVFWTYKLTGKGWSSPIVWGNKVFITTAVLEPKNALTEVVTATIDSTDSKNSLSEIYSWRLICIDLKTGKELWNRVVYKGHPRIKIHPGNTYASETPVTDGKRIYTYFGMTGVFCYNLEGALLWQKDLGAYKTQYDWGTGSSPVLFRNTLYIQVDNEENSFLVALDSKTGKEKWKVERNEKTTYSTPVIWENKMRTELVANGKTARSYDPNTGKLIWELEINGEFAIISPITDSNCIYISNEGEPQKPGILYAVKAGANGNISIIKGETQNNWVKWVTEIETGAYLLYDNYIYNFGNSGGAINCYDANTGGLIYGHSLNKAADCWTSPWVYKNMIYMLDERGMTHVLKAGETFEILPGNKINDKFWASVAVTKNAYIFKGVKYLYCIKKM